MRVVARAYDSGEHQRRGAGNRLVTVHHLAAGLARCADQGRQRLAQPVAGIHLAEVAGHQGVHGVAGRVDHEHPVKAQVAVQRGAEILPVEGPVQVDLKVQVLVGIAPEGVVLEGGAGIAGKGLQGLVDVQAVVLLGLEVLVEGDVYQQHTGEEKQRQQQPRATQQGGAGQRLIGGAAPLRRIKTEVFHSAPGAITTNRPVRPCLTRPSTKLPLAY